MAFFYESHHSSDLYNLFKDEYFDINQNFHGNKYLKQDAINNFLLIKREPVIDTYNFIKHNSNEIVHDDDYKIDLSTNELNTLLFFQHLSKSLYNHFKKDNCFQDFLKIDNELSKLLSSKVKVIKEKRIYQENIERQEYYDMLYG